MESFPPPARPESFPSLHPRPRHPPLRFLRIPPSLRAISANDHRSPTSSIVHLPCMLPPSKPPVCRAHASLHRPQPPLCRLSALRCARPRGRCRCRRWSRACSGSRTKSSRRTKRLRAHPPRRSRRCRGRLIGCWKARRTGRGASGRAAARVSGCTTASMPRYVVVSSSLPRISPT